MNTTDDIPVPVYTVAELEALQAIRRAAGIVPPWRMPSWSRSRSTRSGRTAADLA